MDNEDLRTDMKVLSMIKENGRLCIRNGQLSIEPQLTNKENILFTWGSYATLAARRWWNQDNRHSALLKVQSIIMKIHEINSKLTSQEDQEEFSYLCKEAAKGLTNLQNTYSEDAAINARLSVYIKNLESVSA